LITSAMLIQQNTKSSPKLDIQQQKIN